LLSEGRGEGGEVRAVEAKRSSGKGGHGFPKGGGADPACLVEGGFVISRRKREDGLNRKRLMRMLSERGGERLSLVGEQKR